MLRHQSLHLILCIPIFNDWASVVELITRIDQVLAARAVEVDVLLVDDRSSERMPATLGHVFRKIRQVEVLQLRRNIGHQRAIATGLSFIQEQRPCDAVVIMDGDGEDAPEGILALLDHFEHRGRRHIVFARRGRRSEKLLFKTFYFAYRATHRLLTGRTLAVGNFSIVPREHLDSLVCVAEIWNHYAASVVKARIPHDAITIDRAARIAGRSKMNYASLMTHGLSAISVFADVVGLRLLVCMFCLALLSLIGLGSVVAVRFSTDLAIPGWATVAAGFCIVFFLQTLLTSLVFVFITLQERTRSTFLPVRDYRYFVHEVRSLEGALPGTLRKPRSFSARVHA